MIYKTRDEYQKAVEEFITLRKKGDTPILKLDELYQNLIDTEISIEQDTAINMWLNDHLSNEDFSQFFLVDCTEKSINFLEEQVIPVTEEILEQNGLQQ